MASLGRAGRVPALAKSPATIVPEFRDARFPTLSLAGRVVSGWG